MYRRSASATSNQQQQRPQQRPSAAGAGARLVPSSATGRTTTINTSNNTMARATAGTTTTRSASASANTFQQRSATALAGANSNNHGGAQMRQTIGAVNSSKYTYGVSGGGGGVCSSSSGGITPRQGIVDRSSGVAAQRGNRQDEQSSAAAAAAVKKVLPLQNELLMRIIRRGGMWGVRALRLALGKKLQQYHHYVSTTSAASSSSAVVAMPPSATALPVACVIAALDEYGVSGGGSIGGVSGGVDGGRIGAAASVAPMTAAYVLYWLGPEVVARTCNSNTNNNTRAVAGTSELLFPSPVMVVAGAAVPHAAAAIYSSSQAQQRQQQAQAQRYAFDPTTGAFSETTAVSSSSAAPSSSITSALRPSNYTQQQTRATENAAYYRKNVVQQQPSNTTMGRMVNSAGTPSNSSSSSSSHSSSHYFVDVDALMRLLGCWLTHDQLRRVQCCYSLLIDRVGRPAAGFGGGRGGMGMGGHGAFPPPSASSSSSSLGIKIPRLVSADGVGAGKIVTLRDLITHLDIVKHPDCVSGAVRKREAVECFYHLWGVPWVGSDGVGIDQQHNYNYFVDSTAGMNLRGSSLPLQSLVSSAPISMELFCQFHADFCVSYTSEEQFSALIPALWGFSKELLATVPTPSPPLSRAATDAIFETVDNNKNGILSLAEIDAAICTRFPQFNYKPLIMRAYKLADKNRSGHISKSEFHRFVVYIAHLKNFSDLFQRLDTDRSRSLSLEELVNGKELLGLPADTPNSRIRTLFLEVDKNRQGKILFDEFAEALLRQYPPPELFP